MRAGDLATPFPTVSADTAAVAAARLVAEQNLPGLIVVDAAGRPSTILPGTQVLRMAVPHYIQDDPALARVVDEAAADLFLQELGARTVASLMTRTRTPLVAVVTDGSLPGAVTLDVLMDRLVAR